MELVIAPPGGTPPVVVPHPQIPARAILDSLLDPHLLIAPLRDAAGKITDFTIVEANNAAADYYRLDREAMPGRRLLDFLPADNAGALLAMARDAHESGEPLVVNNYAFALEIYGQERRFDIRAVRIDDELVWTWRDVTERHLAARHGNRHWIETHASPYLDATGRMDGFVATSRIVDAQVAAEQQLEHRARTDELTELLNRKEVLSRIETLGAQSRRTGQELGVLFCDLDRFKEINDIHGHAAGDEVLRATAMRLREVLRTSDDLAARIGGDELLVVLHGVRDMDDAVAIAEKLRSAATQPITTPSGPVSTTLSIGVTLAHPDETTDALVARADAAMYRAKQSGRNRVVPFNSEWPVPNP